MGKLWIVINRKRRWTGERPRQWLPMGTVEFKVLTASKVYAMRALPFRGVYVSELWCSRHGLIRPLDAHVERRGVPNVKKVKLADRGSVKHLAALESEYLHEVQPVVEALAMLQYEDGSSRQAGYLGAWTQGSTWFVRLVDKDADAQMTCEGRTLDEALDTLAVLLGSENAPWEPCSRKKKKGA